MLGGLVGLADLLLEHAEAPEAAGGGTTVEPLHPD
jgi:hypothetical protein